MLMLHGRFSGHRGGAHELDRFGHCPSSRSGRLAEHWDVIEDEVTRAASVSGCRCLAIVFSLTSDECDGHPWGREAQAYPRA